MNIPVYDFRPTPYSIVLKYVASAVHIEIEMGMVVVGQLFVIGVFLVMCAASFVSQVATGHFPHISYVTHAGTAGPLMGTWACCVHGLTSSSPPPPLPHT